MQNVEHYRIFADVLRYPDEQLPLAVAQCGELVAKSYPDASRHYVRFADWIEATELDRIEEVYTKTFHIQAICYLDLGYVVFGEDYKRGEFLVNMKREQDAHGNPCGNELADNLVNVLTLLPLIKDQGFFNDLISRILVPSVKSMIKEFDASKMELRNKFLKKKHSAILMEGVADGNVYHNLLDCLLVVLKEDFKHLLKEEQEVQTGFSATFLNNCGSCDTPHSPSNKTVKS